MARARNIKPGFFINDDLASLPMAARLLFAGLWTVADREGRIEDRPKKIKVAILPYDDCDVDSLLQGLHDAGFICRYTVDGQNYIQITNFLKHQNPHPKEAQSVIPAIPCQASEKQVASKLQESDETITKNAIPSIPSESLISESLLFDSPAGEDTEEEKSVEEKPHDPFKTKKQEEQFDQFYSLYPNKKDKKKAKKAWANINPDDLLFKRIMNGVERGRASPEWKDQNGRFVPLPTSWLNGERWNDEYEIASQNNKFDHNGIPY